MHFVGKNTPDGIFINKRLLVIDSALKSIREIESRNRMVRATDPLLIDYLNDAELISFFQLDLENFYKQGEIDVQCK
jgi:hypothetical protein